MTTNSSEESSIAIGDKLLIALSLEDDSDGCCFQNILGKVLEIIPSKKLNGKFKYKLYFKKLNEIRLVKLANMQWSFKSKKGKRPLDDNGCCNITLDSHHSM